MTKQMQTTTTLRCDHCGGVISIHLDTDERGDQVAYTCAGCGCRWGWGMVLEQPGGRCPVHGTEALRQAAVITSDPALVLAWGQAELDRQLADFGTGGDDDEIPF